MTRIDAKNPSKRKSFAPICMIRGQIFSCLLLVLLLVIEDGWTADHADDGEAARTRSTVAQGKL
jgi:hypothetical protein